MHAATMHIRDASFLYCCEALYTVRMFPFYKSFFVIDFTRRKVVKMRKKSFRGIKSDIRAQLL